MSEPYLAQIQMVGFNFAPRGHAQCDGQILPINQNQSLYSLLGTTYGGDGRTSFALPDLRGRVAMGHNGDTHILGTKSGDESVLLGANEMPAHTHNLHAYSDNADTEEPQDAWLARAESNTYVASGTPAALHANSITTATGGGLAHNNVQPSIAINFIIALQGLFPSRN